MKARVRRRGQYWQARRWLTVEALFATSAKLKQVLLRPVRRARTNTVTYEFAVFEPAMKGRRWPGFRQ